MAVQRLERLAALMLVFALVALPAAAFADDAADAAASDDDAAVEAVAEGEFLVTIDTAGAFSYYSFTAPEDGLYSFTTQGDYDTYAYAFDEEWNLIAEDDDGSDDGSFNACINVVLQAGESCYLAFGFYSAYDTGNYVVELECSSMVSLAAGETATCAVEAGESATLVIVPEESGLYAIYTSGDLDTYLVLYDADWLQMTYDDDSAADCNAQVVAWLEAGQTYYAVVDLYYSDEAGEFAVSVEACESEALAAGDVVAVSVDADAAYFLFTAEEAGVYTIYSTGDCDTYVFVCDLDGSLLTYDDDSGEDLNAQVSFALAAGETVVVEYSLYSSDDSGDFTVVVEQAEMAAFDLEAENAATIDGSGDATYFVFTPEETGMYSFTLSATGGYVALDIYDATWEELGALTLGEVEYDWSYYLDWLFDDEDEEDDAGADAGADDTLTVALVVADEEADTADEAADEADSSTITLVLQAGETYLIELSYDEDDVPQALAVSAEYFEIAAYDLASELAVELEDFYDYEYYAFTPDETALYVFTTAGDADSYISVYDADWNEIAYDDDGAEDYNACVSVVLEAGQTYYLAFTLAYYDDVTDFTVTAEQIALLELDAAAENAAVVDESGASTYYVYTAEETGPVVLTLTGAGEGDFEGILYLYDAGGELEDAVSVSVYEGEGASESVVVLLEAGETYVFELAYEGGTPESLAVTVAAVEIVEVSDEGYAVAFDSAEGEVMAYLSYTAAESGIYDFTLSGVAEGELFAYAFVANEDWGYLGYAIATIEGEGEEEAVGIVSIALAEGETCLIELYVYSYTDASADVVFSVVAAEITDVAEAIAAGVPEDFAASSEDAEASDDPEAASDLEAASAA